VQLELAEREGFAYSFFSFFAFPRGSNDLLCPDCHCDNPRRSRRRSVKDYVVGLARLRPWRCRACESRFYAWAAPVGYVGYVHCDKCGNMDLPRISPEHGMSAISWVYRLFRVPAYRCAPCRNRFFSVRIHRRIVAARPPLEPRVESQSVPQ